MDKEGIYKHRTDSIPFFAYVSLALWTSSLIPYFFVSEGLHVGIGGGVVFLASLLLPISFSVWVKETLFVSSWNKSKPTLDISSAIMPL